MPMIKIQSSLGANATVYPVQGSQYEFLPFDALVEFALLANTGAAIQGTVYSGSDLLMQAAVLDILATASPIIYPDHFLLSDAAGAGERLGVQLTETAGAAAVARTAVRVTPL